MSTPSFLILAFFFVAAGLASPVKLPYPPPLPTLPPDNANLDVVHKTLGDWTDMIGWGIVIYCAVSAFLLGWGFALGALDWGFGPTGRFWSVHETRDRGGDGVGGVRETIVVRETWGDVTGMRGELLAVGLGGLGVI